MGHPEISNETPFAFEAALATDEEGRPLFVAVVKATYCIAGKRQLTLAETQVPVNQAGEHWGKPGESSYKYEPEAMFSKVSTDVVLVGSAFSRNARGTQVDVRLSVGTLAKIVRVIGDRYWVKTLGLKLISPPQPFESIPLHYERAFGGWDRSNANREKHVCEQRNPVGKGFRVRGERFEEGVLLPNLEDPHQLISSYGDTPPPAGMGFTSPSWQPRSALAGTYDEEWQKGRMPLLPLDFDRRFFNAASAGLIAGSYLRGDEPVLIENVCPDGPIVFDLPGSASPRCVARLRVAKEANMETNLDTVIINTDEKLLFLIWKASTPLRAGLHDLLAVKVFA